MLLKFVITTDYLISMKFSQSVLRSILYGISEKNLAKYIVFGGRVAHTRVARQNTMFSRYIIAAAQNMYCEKKIRLMKVRRTASVGSGLSGTDEKSCSSSDLMTLHFDWEF